MQLAYSIALFLHIVGVLGLFIGVGLELAILARMRQAAAVAQVREALWYGRVVGGLMSVASLLTFAAGLFMMITAWGFTQAWLDVAVPLFLVLAALGPAVNGRHFTALAGQAFATPDGPVPASLRARIFDPVATASVQTMAALMVGIVFLMTVKPSLVWSLATVGVALALGLLSTLPVRRAGRMPVAGAARASAGGELSAAGR